MAAPTALRERLITQLIANKTNEASYSDYDTIGRNKKYTHIPFSMAFKRSGYLIFFLIAVDLSGYSWEFKLTVFINSVSP